MIILGMYANHVVSLVTDRAIRSKLATTTDTDPPGRKFVGSTDFPSPLIEAIERYDPAGVLLGELDLVTGDDYLHPPSEREKNRLLPIMTKKLAGKKIICLSGAKDKLVPHAQAVPFLTWLNTAVDKNFGWFRDQGLEIEDIVDPNGRHEFSGLMRKEAERWLCDYLARDEGVGGSRDSKL